MADENVPQNLPVPSCGVEVNGRLLRARRTEPPTRFTPEEAAELQNGFRTKNFRRGHPGWIVYKATETKGGTFEIHPNGNYTFVTFVKDGDSDRQEAVETKVLVPTNGLPCDNDRIKTYENLYVLSIHFDELPSHHFWAEAADISHQQAQRVANEIDRLAQERDRKKTIERQQDRTQQLRLWPDIDNQHPEWIYTWDRLREELISYNADHKDGSVLKLLLRLFDKNQIRMLVPSKDRSFITKMQEENEEEYEKALASPRFQGTPDNLLTKLTMAHFGLPVAPLTLTNTFNIGKTPDDPDEDDEFKNSTGGVEKIFFAEKPLEFLDAYDERSYGFPMQRCMPIPEAWFASN